MAKYSAELSGSSWAQGPAQHFDTITAARAWAEEYGDTADSCTITDKAGRTVARHERSRNAPGGWFKAAI